VFTLPTALQRPKGLPRGTALFMRASGQCVIDLPCLAGFLLAEWWGEVRPPPRSRCSVCQRVSLSLSSHSLTRSLARSLALSLINEAVGQGSNIQCSVQGSSSGFYWITSFLSFFQSYHWKTIVRLASLFGCCVCVCVCSCIPTLCTMLKYALMMQQVWATQRKTHAEESLGSERASLVLR